VTQDFLHGHVIDFTVGQSFGEADQPENARANIAQGEPSITAFISGAVDFTASSIARSQTRHARSRVLHLMQVVQQSGFLRRLLEVHFLSHPRTLRMSSGMTTWPFEASFVVAYAAIVAWPPLLPIRLA
jgi:hypothetical protein